MKTDKTSFLKKYGFFILYALAFISTIALLACIFFVFFIPVKLFELIVTSENLFGWNIFGLAFAELFIILWLSRFIYKNIKLRKDIRNGVPIKEAYFRYLGIKKR